MILLVTPPLTQLNTPYPATTQLKAFLDSRGYATAQVDLGIELINNVYSSRFLASVLPNGFPNAKEYVATVDAVMSWLRGEDPTIAARIASRTMLPEGGRFSDITDLEWCFGTSGTDDRARYIATLYMEDIADMLRQHVDPHFDLIRYAEHVCTYAESFDEIESALRQPPSPIEDLMLRLLEKHITDVDVVAFTVPFPGCLLPALRCGEYIKRQHPGITVCMGGGFPNTEWRSLREARLFDYVDYVTLDDGELPRYRLMQYFDGELSEERLLRTYKRMNGEVVWIDDTSSDMPTQTDNDTLPVPDFSGLPLDRYLSLADMSNPMQRLWSCGRWNKLMMAHGCYWAKCAFCDTSLDYIRRYDAPQAATVVDRMERIKEQTGGSGFHFVDEAIPPQLLRKVCEEILRRGLQVSFWGNIRFEKAYDAELCKLMSDAGCIAVSGGLEVASDRLLKLMNKGVTVRQVVESARNMRDAGIMVHTYLMYGFPTETLQETIGALENVRRMFDEGIVQSAFWHRYAMTVHSASGCNPQNYGAGHLGRVGENPFCNNEIPFEARFDYNLDAVGKVLYTATYNYMNGTALDIPAEKWFKKIKR